ncbi:MAG: ankyrin repeat domain-containing protein [Synergistaceae bacterium]|nr:ankyrin repeat domain-containing protein [Synergistaceae bacterium]
MKKTLLVFLIIALSGVLSGESPAMDDRERATQTLLRSAIGLNVREVELLLKRGADINAMHSDYSLKPLTLAASWNPHAGVIRFLIESGADVNEVMYDGNNLPINALCRAAAYNKNPEILKVLIEYGADVKSSVEIEEGENWSPLMFAITYNPNPEITRFLIDQYKDFDIEKDGEQLLWLTLEYVGNPRVLRLLTNMGADVNIKNESGQTLLMSAIEKRVIELVPILLDAGAKVTKEIIEKTREIQYYENTPLFEKLENRFKELSGK